MKAFDKFISTTDADYRVIGCRGHSVFEQLPYYRCSICKHVEALVVCTPPRTHSCHLARLCLSSLPAELQILYRFNLFWHLAIAHALLYGVVRGFWSFVLRKPSEQQVAGTSAQNIFISQAVQKTMSRRVKSSNMKRTASLSGKIPDVTR